MPSAASRPWPIPSTSRTRDSPPGLHDYSYQAGWLRGQIGLESNDYGPFAFSAFHQYGFSDAWTLGLRTEGTARMVNGGPRCLSAQRSSRRLRAARRR
jgi:outer membrane usher protein FimD/PapC